MGNCIVIQRNQSASNLQWPPFKEDTLCGELTLKPQSPPMAHLSTFQEFSCSKDEIFFDANVLMDSDCDDFFSVNGGTPSQCTTPVHPNSYTEAPCLDNTLYAVQTSNSTPEHSPTEMKQLIDFFRDSFSGDMGERDQYLQGIMETKTGSFDLPPKPTSQSPLRSSATSGRKQKSPQCCLPSLVRSLSISGKKKTVVEET